MHQINECTKNYFQTFSEFSKLVRGISALSEGILNNILMEYVSDGMFSKFGKKKHLPLKTTELDYL